MTVNVEAEATRGCGTERGLKLARLLGMLAQHMDTPRKQPENRVAAGGAHGCASELNVSGHTFDREIERDTVLAGYLFRASTAAGENASQTVACSAEVDGLDVGLTVVGATDQNVQGIHRRPSGGEAEATQQVGIARVIAQGVHGRIYFQPR